MINLVFLNIFCIFASRKNLNEYDKENRNLQANQKP